MERKTQSREYKPRQRREKKLSKKPRHVPVRRSIPTAIEKGNTNQKAKRERDLVVIK